MNSEMIEKCKEKFLKLFGDECVYGIFPKVADFKAKKGGMKLYNTISAVCGIENFANIMGLVPPGKLTNGLACTIMPAYPTCRMPKNLCCDTCRLTDCPERCKNKPNRCGMQLDFVLERSRAKAMGAKKNES